MHQFGIQDATIHDATKNVGKALTLASEAIGPGVVQVVENASLEAAKIAGDAVEGGVKLVSKIPIPMIGAGLKMLGQIQQILHQSKINKRNATAAWGRLRVIEAILMAIDADVRVNAQRLAVASAPALKSMNEAASRVALGLAHIKVLISDYSLAPGIEPCEGQDSKAWCSAWETTRRMS